MILLMGIAGSGKGTQSKLLAEKDGFDLISTGELLRDYGSKEQHERMNNGEILGDEEVAKILEKVFEETQELNNVILDGFPRRLSQAEWLLGQAKTGRFEIDCVIHLTASKQAVKARLLERARNDDHEDGIEQRFNDFEKDTVPILEYLVKSGVKLKEINAERPVEVVHAEIVNWLKEHTE